MCSETVISRIKGENCDGTDFKMGVAANLLLGKGTNNSDVPSALTVTSLI